MKRTHFLRRTAMFPVLLLLCGCGSAPWQNPDPVSWGDEVVRAEILASGDISVPTPACHASTLVETSEGLLAAWFGGTAEGHPDVSIYVSALRGGNWEEPRKVADGLFGDKRYPCWNPVLWCGEEGKVVLFYKVGPSPQTWRGLYKTSDDNGRTWSEAISLPEGYLGPVRNKPGRLSDGRILYPASFEEPGKWNVYVEYSDGQLERWEKALIDNSGIDAIQPTILFHDDGRLQLLCRTRGYRHIAESWSDDGGKTWSPLQPTMLPANNSGIDAATCGGVHVLVYNPTPGRGRNELVADASADGRLWRRTITLERQKAGEFSYPAVICGSDGSLHITYTYNRKWIRYVNLRLKRENRL